MAKPDPTDKLLDDLIKGKTPEDIMGEGRPLEPTALPMIASHLGVLSPHCATAHSPSPQRSTMIPNRLGTVTMTTTISLSVFLSTAASLAAGPLNTFWYGSNGTFPDDSCPYTLMTVVGPPTLSGSVLTLVTSMANESIYYDMQGTDLSIPDPLVIEANVRYVEGTYGQGNTRTAAGIAFTSSPLHWNILQLGLDEAFLLAATFTRGQTANVDTNDSFHTYRIEVTGAGAITVYQDSVQILTGEVFNNGQLPIPIIFFGDGDSFAAATTEWTYIAHNAGAAPCGGPVSVDFSIGSTTWGRMKGLYESNVSESQERYGHPVRAAGSARW